MQISKISRFPRHIREELNRRLDQSEPGKVVLHWLNSLPEVQAVLNAEFKGEPVKKQNLDNWKNTGLKNWQLTQTALEFTDDSLPEDLDTAALEKMSAKLIRCLQVRYAAVASSLPAPQDDPDAELRRLAGLCANLTTLRRGDLSAGRLALEQQRLALTQAKTDQQKEEEFWEWTKRPDIQAKLYPHRDPDKIRRDVDRLLSRRLLGIPDPGAEPDESADPALLI
jgi:hypothetical protein